MRYRDIRQFLIKLPRLNTLWLNGMISKKLTIWHWTAITFAVCSLIGMIVVTTWMMPTKKDGDRILFMKALSVVKEIDPIAKETYISVLVDKYLNLKGYDRGYMEGVEAIAKDYPSPEFMQELARLKRERDDYLNNLSARQIDAISSTIVAWFFFMAILNGGGLIIIRLVKWGLSDKSSNQA